MFPENALREERGPGAARYVICSTTPDVSLENLMRDEKFMFSRRSTSFRTHAVPTATHPDEEHTKIFFRARQRDDTSIPLSIHLFDRKAFM